MFHHQSSLLEHIALVTRTTIRVRNRFNSLNSVKEEGKATTGKPTSSAQMSNDVDAEI